jgi:hypothetical protein
VDVRIEKFSTTCNDLSSRAIDLAILDRRSLCESAEVVVRESPSNLILDRQAGISLAGSDRTVETCLTSSQSSSGAVDDTEVIEIES